MQKILSFFSLKGRSDRKSFTIAWVLLYIMLCVSLFFNQTSKEYTYEFFLGYLVLLSLLFPISVRRLHDINLSGWYAILLMMTASLNVVTFSPLFVRDQFFATAVQFGTWIALAMIAYLAIKKGTHGPNRFGEDPTWAEAPRVQLDEFLSWQEEEPKK